MVTGDSFEGIMPVDFLSRFTASKQFQEVFQEGMSLIEETAKLSGWPGPAGCPRTRQAGIGYLCKPVHAPDHAPHAIGIMAAAAARGQFR